jgi:23S rRNA pseudouridine1911/1915/1917 synthase
LVADDNQEVSLPIGSALHARNRCLMAIREDEEGKPSSTRVMVLDRFEQEGPTGYSRVRLSPKTGRQHQIRVHMAAIGHPLVADHLYGTNCGLSWTGAEEGSGRLERFALHAESLTIIHPVTGKPLTITAPLASDIASLYQALKQNLSVQSFPLDNDFAEPDFAAGEQGRRFSHIPIGEHEHDAL